MVNVDDPTGQCFARLKLVFGPYLNLSLMRYLKFRNVGISMKINFKKIVNLHENFNALFWEKTDSKEVLESLLLTSLFM